MSKDFSTTVSNLEKQANASSEKLSETLQALVSEAQPKTQAQYLLADAKYRAQEALYVTQTTIDAAREGDPEARKKVIKAAAIGAAVIGVCILRRTLIRRRKR